MDVPRVVIVSPAFPPIRGGSATYFGTLVRQLEGVADITLISLKVEGAPGEETVDGAIVKRALPDGRGSGRLARYLKVLPSVFVALRNERKKGSFVLHAHSNGIYGYSASLFSSIYNVPMIKEVQDTSDKRFVLKAGKVHVYIAVGEFVRRRLLSFGIPGSKVMVFPSINPPELGAMAERALASRIEHPDRVRFVHVGWLVNRIKGVDVLIEAFSIAYARNKELELVIIGDGPDRGMLERMAKGLPISFLGDLPFEELVEEMADCDVVVLASHEEANPRCIIEGYALGIPAIATDVGGIGEELLGGRTGLLVPDNDANALSGAMLELASDPELRKGLGKKGKEFLKGLPTWKELSEAVLLEYWRMWGANKR